MAVKVGTDGVGKERSSALWHLGRGVTTRFVRVDLAGIWNPCLYMAAHC